MAWEFDFLHFMQDLHRPIADVFFKTVTKLGDHGIFCIALSLILFLILKDKRMGATVSLALVTEYIICNMILKNMVARDRPFWTDPSLAPIIKAPTDFSFPSGHSSAVFATATGIFIWNKKWGIFALVLAVLVAVSRLYLTVHFPTDVICGTLIGIVMAIISGMIIKKVDERYPLGNRFGII